MFLILLDKEILYVTTIIAKGATQAVTVVTYDTLSTIMAKL